MKRRRNQRNDCAKILTLNGGLTTVEGGKNVTMAASMGATEHFFWHLFLFFLPELMEVKHSHKTKAGRIVMFFFCNT